jgi:hypothetical protein
MPALKTVPCRAAQFADLLPVTERVLGPHHPRTLSTRANLAYWTEKAAG